MAQQEGQVEPEERKMALLAHVERGVRLVSGAHQEVMEGPG